jgi:hypothetical protein
MAAFIPWASPPLVKTPSLLGIGILSAEQSAGAVSLCGCVIIDRGNASLRRSGARLSQPTREKGQQTKDFTIDYSTAVHPVTISGVAECDRLHPYTFPMVLGYNTRVKIQSHKDTKKGKG